MIRYKYSLFSISCEEENKVSHCCISMVTYFVKLDDVWVSDFLQDSNLTVDALEVGMVLDLVLLQDFDGNL